jgi:hypothetical protein
MRVCTFGRFLEQRTAIRFLTLALNGLRASAPTPELKWISETEELAFSTVKK